MREVHSRYTEVSGGTLVATIVKSPVGTWKAVVRRKGWRTASKTFRTKRDAEDWARRTEDEMIRGIYINRAPSERLTIREALHRYIQEVTPTKRESTQLAERRKAQYLADVLGDYALAALTPDIASKYRDDRIRQGKANNTVRLELALLGHLYTVAIREWGVGLIYNPVANIRKPSPGRGRNRRLSPDEEQRLLEACDGHSNPLFGWIVRIAIYTGMRKSEIVTLRRGQVDLAKRVVWLHDTKNGSARGVPLSRNAEEIFRKVIEYSKTNSETDLQFAGEPGRDGKRRPYQFDPIWQQVLHRLGIEGLRFHDLRHEAVSRFVEAGLSDQEVASISGHKTMQMLRRYTHLRVEDLVDKLDNIHVEKST